MKPLRAFVAVVATLLASAAAARAEVPAPPADVPPPPARPNATVGLTTGLALADLRTSGPGGVFHLGLRPSLMLGRRRDDAMGAGPYLEVLTVAFDTLELGGGIDWLIPALRDFPLVLSGGGFARTARGIPGWEPGVSATAFLGGRSHNFHSWYGLAGGLFVQGRYGLGEAKQADLLIGAQVDLAVLALPFLYLWNVVAH